MQCLACLVFTSNSENEDFREMAVARAKKVWLNDMIRDQPIDALPSSPLDS